MDWKDLFHAHLSHVTTRAADILRQVKVDTLVIDAGEPLYHFEDDRTFPYRPYHHFLHWCPAAGDSHMVIFEAGKKPRLLYYSPKDFWHEYPPFGTPFWADEYDIQFIPTREELWDQLKKNAQAAAYVGPAKTKAESMGLKTEVPTLLKRLNWERSYKTAYEIECIREATRVASLGHKAARDAFIEGLSELDIHYAYLRACEAQDHDMPYDTIIALNEKGAFLHYTQKRLGVRKGKVLLIDAGAMFHGYCSDITRTYCAEKTDPEFKSMVNTLNNAQLDLCRSVKVGMSFSDLHYASHQKIAQILLDHEVIKDCSVEAAITQGITRTFYPHGISHLLGIFVHDVAGTQKNAQGDPSPQDQRFPKLRTTRTIEPRHVFTIEPGIYFISMLLDPAREGDNSRHYNWAKIEQLQALGGIRIEDDIVMTAEGPQNLTRKFLP